MNWTNYNWKDMAQHLMEQRITSKEREELETLIESRWSEQEKWEILFDLMARVSMRESDKSVRVMENR